MQFFKGDLKLEDCYSYERDKVKIEARALNNKYWLLGNFQALHALISNVTARSLVFLIMYEGHDIEISGINDFCQEYIAELKKEASYTKIDYCADKMSFNEITLNKFLELFSENYLDKMYDDKSAMMRLLYIDNTKLICEESLLEPFSKTKRFKKRFLPKEELARIRNNRLRKGVVTYQPVHYIVIEDCSDIADQIDNELIFELRKARRIVSRRMIKLKYTDITRLASNRFIIQNLNNLDGGVVIVDLNGIDSEETRDIIKAVYSEYNNYSGKYLVIFHAPDGIPKIREEIKTICSLWPFITIRNAHLNRKSAEKQLKEVAGANDVIMSDDVCSDLLKDKSDFSYSEINELFRKWYLTDYSIDKYYPQYRLKIDEYYHHHSNGKDAQDELNELIGLTEVKELCRRIIDFYEIQKLRKAVLTDSYNVGMHMVFTGNPGTAKTTVARILARIFKEKGILSKGELIEVGRADLVGKYVGWTARIVRDYFNKAKGSVLFIDEAYSLVDDDKNSFGTEAINTIVQEMENKRDDVVVILAGYKTEMHKFISSNSGLESRISFHVNFPDYSGKELYEILSLFSEKSHYKLEGDVESAFMSSLEKTDTTKGNGRLVRNVFEKARLHQAERIMKLPETEREKELFTLIGEDFGGEVS